MLLIHPPTSSLPRKSSSMSLSPPGAASLALSHTKVDHRHDRSAADDPSSSQLIQENYYSSDCGASRAMDECFTERRNARLRLELPADAVQALENLESARSYLQKTQNLHDCRRQHCVEDLERYEEGYEQGLFTFGRSEFDVRQVQIGQLVTEDLIWAEGNVEEKVKEVEAMGVNPNHYRNMDQGSLPGSPVEPPIAPATIARVERWLDFCKSDSGSVMEEDESVNIEIDDWEAKPVEICDSGSVVASGDWRKYIDRWHAACAQQREAYS